MRWVLTANGHKETFGGDGSILFDCGGGYLVHMSKVTAMYA